MQIFLKTLLCLTACSAISVHAANSLNWQTNHVDAQIERLPLPELLEQISTATGWEVYMEPGTDYKASVKFKDKSDTDALKRLLGTLSFSLTPQSNSGRKLYVFKTSVGQATQLIRSPAAAAKSSRIPNELIVFLQPGCGSIDDLAKKLNAKVLGRVEEVHAYRLQFADEAVAEKSRQDLRQEECVANIESNYSIDPLPIPKAKPIAATGTGTPAFDLTMNPDPNKMIVALIDSHVQPLDPSMQKFMLAGINQAGEWSGSPDEPTHGTFMAESILHAQQSALGNSGQSSSLQILPVDVYGNNSTSSTFDIANGIIKAGQQGARIINLSLGSSGDSPFLQQVIGAASRQGLLVIAAAGNTPVTYPTFPAAYNNVLAVTASDNTGKLAPYANRGAFVDIMFPGNDIGKVGTTAYQVNGTSTATAFASGTAAALMQTKSYTPSATATFMTTKWSFSGK
ncbi:MAG: peptidase [Verrucomicrobiales bacterium]|nr:peptidase [Verrucomicrobiales bacterium]